jgi:tRNA nucleotidyltransferase/poly(A) polymerase
MPDFVYLLENRLSLHQQAALRSVRETARELQMPVFLVGDAVRDLVCGNSVREMEVLIHGNTAEMKKPLVSGGAAVWWENASARRISLRFPGSVLLEVSSARQIDYPKCGKPVYTWASIHEDLRSRDFTANAMAISLNEGSYGLLMDPLNGVADIELRQLRLVSNYGFLEEPARMVRASRLRVRLGFQMEERTQRRYENAREEGMIQYLAEEERRRELEQIVHEEEALKVMAAHEAEGWMKALHPSWTTARVDTEKLHALHDFSIELQLQGVHPDLSAAQAHFLTAKLSAKDLAALKEKFLRPGFVKAWEGLEASAAQLSKALLTKEMARPSACYNLLTSFAPEAVLWLGFTTRHAGIREKYEAFLKIWPQSRQKLPLSLMAEMRITSELPGYAQLAHQLFLHLIDGELQTEGELRAFLAPFSPPAPPPPVSIKRSRTKKQTEVRLKSRSAEEEDDRSDDEEDGDIAEIDDEGIELDFRIGDSDEARILGDEDDGEEEDVFAQSSVGEEDLDVNDEDEEADEELSKPVRPSRSEPTARSSEKSARPAAKAPPAAVGKSSGAGKKVKEKSKKAAVAKPATKSPSELVSSPAHSTPKKAKKDVAENDRPKPQKSASKTSTAAHVKKAAVGKPQPKTSSKTKPAAIEKAAVKPKLAVKKAAGVKKASRPVKADKPSARHPAGAIPQKKATPVGKKKKR